MYTRWVIHCIIIYRACLLRADQAISIIINYTGTCEAFQDENKTKVCTFYETRVCRMESCLRDRDEFTWNRSKSKFPSKVLESCGGDRSNVDEKMESTEERSPLLERKLSTSTKIAYALGHIFNDLTAAMWFSYTLIYFQRVALLEPIVAGALLLLGKRAVKFLCMRKLSNFLWTSDHDGFPFFFCSRPNHRRIYDTNLRNVGRPVSEEEDLAHNRLGDDHAVVSSDIRWF